MGRLPQRRLVPPDLRAPITESWQRCASAGLDATHRPSLSMISADELRDIWFEHPLSLDPPRSAAGSVRR